MITIGRRSTHIDGLMCVAKCPTQNATHSISCAYRLWKWIVANDFARQGTMATGMLLGSYGSRCCRNDEMHALRTRKIHDRGKNTRTGARTRTRTRTAHGRVGGRAAGGA